MDKKKPRVRSFNKKMMSEIEGNSSFIIPLKWSVERDLFVSIKNKVYLLSCIYCSSISTVLYRGSRFRMVIEP